MNKLVFLILLPILLLLSACNVLRGSGNIRIEPRQVSHFDRVSMGGSGELIITQGDEESLTVEADDNLLPRIKTEVRDGTLHLGLKGKNWPNFLQPTRPIKFNLIMKEVGPYVCSQWGRKPDIRTHDLSVEISGSGDVVIGALEAEKLKVQLSGSATCALSGQVVTQEIGISGSGEYRAPKLNSQTVKAKISGSGHSLISVRDSLSVNISGSGQVDYYGSPGSVSKEISGSGSVRSQGNP